MSDTLTVREYQALVAAVDGSATGSVPPPASSWFWTRARRSSSSSCSGCRWCARLTPPRDALPQRARASTSALVAVFGALAWLFLALIPMLRGLPAGDRSRCLRSAAGCSIVQHQFEETLLGPLRTTGTSTIAALLRQLLL